MADSDIIMDATMADDERKRIEEVVDLCLTARKRLGTHGVFRLRVLLDMMLLELGKELARRTRNGSP